MNFIDLLKRFNFSPTLNCPTIKDNGLVIIQVYTNKSNQTVEVSYTNDDDYYCIELEHQTGKSISGTFEDMLDLELWTDLFNKNYIYY